MEFAQRVFKLLDKQNKSKAELARYLNVRPTTVTEWDTKGKKPSLEYVSRISEFLGVSCDYLLTGKEPTPKLSENEKDMLELLNQVSERNQVRLIGNVENMVKEMNKFNIQAEENAG